MILLEVSEGFDYYMNSKHFSINSYYNLSAFWAIWLLNEVCKVINKFYTYSKRLISVTFTNISHMAYLPSIFKSNTNILEFPLKYLNVYLAELKCLKKTKNRSKSS